LFLWLCLWTYYIILKIFSKSLLLKLSTPFSAFSLFLILYNEITWLKWHPLCSGVNIFSARVHSENQGETKNFFRPPPTSEGRGDVNSRRQGQNASPSRRIRVTPFRSIYACTGDDGELVIASRGDISIRLIGRRRRRWARARWTSRKLPFPICIPCPFTTD